MHMTPLTSASFASDQPTPPLCPQPSSTPASIPTASPATVHPSLESDQIPSSGIGNQRYGAQAQSPVSPSSMPTALLAPVQVTSPAATPSSTAADRLQENTSIDTSTTFVPTLHRSANPYPFKPLMVDRAVQTYPVRIIALPMPGDDEDEEIDVESIDADHSAGLVPIKIEPRSTPPPIPEPVKPTQKPPKVAKSSKKKEYAEKPLDAAEKTKPKARTSRATRKKTHVHSPFDSVAMSMLSAKYPDNYHNAVADLTEPGPITVINAGEPLALRDDANIRDTAPITSMVLSPDHSMLATFCNNGCVRIWDLDTFQEIQFLRDADEPNIEEYYVGRFSLDMKRIVVGGRLKDRKRWSALDDDNHILPCPLKVFDVLTGKVIAKYEGHEEEILSVKYLEYMGDSYCISSSQDGYIIRWKIASDWSRLLARKRMEDGITCMAFTITFLPHTGNRYFLAACDAGVRLFDFGEAQLLQSFDGLYSCYCDCAKFISPTAFETPPTWDQVLDSRKGADYTSPMFGYFVTRGVEVVEDEQQQSTIPNKVKIYKLIYPNRLGGQFEIREVKSFQDDDYVSNSWLTKVTCNQKYVAAPTCDGRIFIYHMQTGNVSAILRGHEELEVRDVIFHPTRPLLFSCADDGCVKVYHYAANKDS
ncbi:WD40-repeat-containing domain protein [Polychytrium aggregatum]|uniref:WD40-repeat-containing domain protein n=1 Tax=Polychytrium aggregatum TaxID=110093 RepID=UPI0022FE90D0|nr:WD40-repeat-containing domain protein [Polychytrium aggregatum]KAI9202680.1 WD40-repeat-containing domain protein [Polychytrium aggregatum]